MLRPELISTFEPTKLIEMAPSLTPSLHAAPNPVPLSTLQPYWHTGGPAPSTVLRPAPFLPRMAEVLIQRLDYCEQQQE
jgi:hypothetical protein